MRSRSYRKTNGIRILVIALIIVAVATLVIFNGTLFRLGSALLAGATRPPAEELAQLPQSILAGRLAEAESQLARTQYQSILYEQLVAENKRLKEVLNIVDQQDVAVARVVSRPPQAPFDSLIARVSSSANIAPGDFVFFNDVLIGEVARSEGESIAIELVSNPGKIFIAAVGDPAVTVELRGLGAGASVFSVLNEVRVVPGNQVVSESDRSRVVGVVSRIVERDESTTKTVFVHTPVSFSDIDFVTIRKQ